MKQNPRQLINDIHERIADDDTERKILADYSEDPTVWGYSKVWLFIVLIPAMVMFRISASRLTGQTQLYGFGATVGLAALGILVTVASPGEMEARDYFAAIVSRHAHQQEMIHDTDPEESRLEQPKNDSLLGRITRLPLVRDWPVIGAGEYRPTQALVEHERPYRGEYAIQRDDGSLIAAIRILPIPLRLESEDAKRKVSRAVADALEAAVDYDAQWFSPTRVADFESRRTQWKDRAREYQAEVDSLTSTRGEAADIDAIRRQILADIADERAAGINLHETVKRIRDHYFLVSVDPGEAVVERSSEAGGLGSIPGFGKLVEKKRLREQADSEEHINDLLGTLERRTDDLATELSRVEGITTNQLSAVEFSKAIADYYRGRNVRAHDEFTQTIRGCPVPGEMEAGDPEHETSYQHIVNRDRAGSPPSPSPTPTGVHAADGGATTAADGSEATVSASETSEPPRSDSLEEPAVPDEPANVLNEDALVGLAADEDEFSWRYKSALAPDTFVRDTREHEYCVIDETYLSKTLEVRDWPPVPGYGFLDSVVSFSMPSVDVTISTHLTGEDERKAERDLAEAADSLKGKVKNFARNKWLPDYFVEQVVEEYSDVKRTQRTVSATDYGLYTSHTYIEVRAPDRERLDKAVRKIRSRMQDASADAKPLKYHHKLGYKTAAPACKDFVGGKTKMTGDGLSRLIPWTARNLIEPGGIELGINEDTGDPIVLDLQNRETGYNVGIWATIGGGKTTTLTRLLTRTKMQNPDMPVVIIDPLQEFAGYTWLFDGERVVVGSDTGINPLQIEETPPEKLQELGEESPKRNAMRRGMEFVRSYYDFMEIPFEDKQGTWRTALKEGFRRRGITDNPETHSKDSPTLRDDIFPIFEEMVNEPGRFLRDALVEIESSKQRMREKADSILQDDIGALEEGGEFEHLSKATDIDIENIDVLYLDLQNYESESTAGLMMEPLITAVYEQAKALDGPMLFSIDEFHYMLHNSSSMETLKQVYRHSRHSDLSMITATQSVEEFFTENDEGEKQLTKSASQLTKLMSVKIWHYLEEMDEEWASEFGMSGAEQQYVEDASTGDPTAQALLQVEKEGSYPLDVNFSDELNPREFAANQYDPTDHGSDPLAYLDAYVDEAGQDVTEWSWSKPSRTDQLPESDEHDQEPEGTEIADGTTVTTDVSDVDANPGSDATEHAQSEGAAENDTEDADESGSIASRLKNVGSSIKGGKGGDTENSDDELFLTDVGPLDARSAGALRAVGIETVEQLFEANEEEVAAAEGFDPTRAGFIQRKAAQALGKPEGCIGIDGFLTESGSAVRAADRQPADDGEEVVSAVRRVEDVSPADSSSGDESECEAGATDKARGDEANHGLTDIRQVGEGRAVVLREAGFETVADVADTDPNALADVDGIGHARAETIVENATDLVDEQTETPAAAAGGDD